MAYDDNMAHVTLLSRDSSLNSRVIRQKRDQRVTAPSRMTSSHLSSRVLDT